MRSIQSGVANLVARTIRNSFFIHKAETFTQRKSFERLSVFTKYPRFVKTKPTRLGGLKAISFYPRKINEDRVILYLHGGAYCAGSIKTHKALMARVARAAKCKLIGVNYRLAPDHPYPAALEDALEAYNALLKEEHQQIFLVGDSAGGGLVLALMLKLRSEGRSMPAGASLISPWTDLNLTGESIRTKQHKDPLINPKVLKYFASLYIGNEDPCNPYISPLYADLKDLPPILIQVGGNEVILDDSTRLAKKLKKAGCDVELEVWDKMFHVWHYLGGVIPEAKTAINKIGSFVINTHNKQKVNNRKKLVQMEMV